MKSSDPVNSVIASRLRKREEEHSLRRLRTNKDLIDFCSNDYLGFVHSGELNQLLLPAIQATAGPLSGSTGSRLISGNDFFTEELERSISIFHDSEAALIFNSGYDANLGLFSSLPQRGDTIIMDELIHASIIDGSRLSFANRFSFRHNDLNHLEERLKSAKGNVFVAVESVYSMDGDFAPLSDLVKLTERYNAALIVDEAHATGIFGNQGQGRVHQLNLQHKVFARVVTFGKALGCHGAVVLGSNPLRSYLINFARSFIYTTAASPFTHVSVKTAYDLLKSGDFPSQIKEKIDFFKNEAGGCYQAFIESDSPIQSLIVKGNEVVKKIESKLLEKKFNIKAILSPTVPAGKERLRICLHTFNSYQDITSLIRIIENNL